METLKAFIDWTAIGAAIGWLAGVLHILLAIPAAIWTSIRIYEYVKSKWPPQVP